MEISDDSITSQRFYGELNSTSQSFYGEINYSLDDQLEFKQNQSGYSEISLPLNLPPIPKLENNYTHYLCPKCYNFPLIKFLNGIRINYTCACFKRKIIFINDIFKQKENFLVLMEDNNSLKSPEFLNNKFAELYCLKHKSYKIHKFRYYCIECHENLCKECCQNHLGDKHNLIVFDYNNPAIYSKIEVINKKLNFFQNNDLNEFFDFNNEKSKENNKECFKLIKLDDSTIVKKESRNDNEQYNLIK